MDNDHGTVLDDVSGAVGSEIRSLQSSAKQPVRPKRVVWRGRVVKGCLYGDGFRVADTKGGSQLPFFDYSAGVARVIRFNPPPCVTVEVTEELRAEIMRRHGYGPK